MSEQFTFTNIISYDIYKYIFTCTLVLSPFIVWKYTLFVITCSLLFNCAVIFWESYMTKEIEAHDKAVFVTGCDSGLGYNFAKYLDAKGFVVFAGCLNIASDGAKALDCDCSDRLRIVKIDVTDNDSVQRACALTQQQLPAIGLWGIVNNAGIYMVGDVECTPIAKYQKGLNVNLFGAIRVTNAFLPLLRQNHGRVVNITSVHAGFALPHRSVYEVSKRCLETMSDSLRIEMAKFGVRVSMIEPGKFSRCTAINQETLRFKKYIDEIWEGASDEVKQAYSKQTMLSWLPVPPSVTSEHGDITSVSKAVAHAMCSPKPRARYIVSGYGNTVGFIDDMAILAYCYRKLPAWLTDIYGKTYL